MNNVTAVAGITMNLTIYQIDAFADNLFEGNPAAVIPLQNWLDEQLMQKIAAENNLSETAFFVPTETGFHIRWFTPEYEVNLCGHATLASSFVIFNCLDYKKKQIVFQSKSGELFINLKDDKIEMDFPTMPPEHCDIPAGIIEAFGRAPEECLVNEDYIAVYDDEEFVRTVTPDFEKIKQLDQRAVMITAKSKEYDFVSRFFIPNHGIDEDPVTGSSFTKLTPYWAAALEKNDFIAKQVSKRGGIVQCQLEADRVKISGKAVLYMKGEIII